MSASVASTWVDVPEFRVRRPTRSGEVDLILAILPEVAMLLVGGSPEGSDGLIPAVVGWARNIGRALIPTAGPVLTRVGSVLVVDTSVQTQRVTYPVVQELATRHGEPVTFRLPRLGPVSIATAQRSAVVAGGRIEAALTEVGIAFPPGLRSELLKDEVLRRRCQGARLGDAAIDAVVVGSQQNPSVRSLLSVVRREGISSYYLPHAPTADNAFYHDIPTTHALLRGEAEADFYARLGAGPDSALMVVGNPSAAQSLADTPPATRDIVYAASTHSQEVLQADIDVIRHAVDRPVKVSLHPRMRSADVTGLFPPDWRIVDAPDTDSYLRSHGARAVVQHGSGVGLEALFLGIEVIDLCPAGERPNYPYIRPPHVQVVGDANGLRAALDALPAREGERAKRIAFARSWCAEVGTAAAVRAADMIEETRSVGTPREPLLDGWAHFLCDP